MGEKYTDNARKLMEALNNSKMFELKCAIDLFSDVKWKTIKFTIPMIPKPSHRPRLSGYRVYVPGAAKNQSFFDKQVRPTLRGLYITTPCKVKSDIYEPTPKSFNQVQKCLAELKILRPWTSTGDVDNFAKAIYDMMQPNEKRHHVGIMEDDCLIIDSTTNKYYSMTPRYEITISYMEKIPDQLKTILRLNK